MNMSDSLTPGEDLYLFQGDVLLSGLWSMVAMTLTPLLFISTSIFLIDYCAFRQTCCYELIRDPCRACRLMLFPAVHQECGGCAGA